MKDRTGRNLEIGSSIVTTSGRTGFILKIDGKRALVKNEDSAFWASCINMFLIDEVTKQEQVEKKTINVSLIKRIGENDFIVFTGNKIGRVEGKLENEDNLITENIIYKKIQTQPLLEVMKEMYFTELVSNQSHISLLKMIKNNEFLELDSKKLFETLKNRLMEKTGANSEPNFIISVNGKKVAEAKDENEIIEKAKQVAVDNIEKTIIIYKKHGAIMAEGIA